METGLFFWSSLDFGGKLDVGRRVDLFFWSSPIFSVKTCSLNKKLRPPFQISGHASGDNLLSIVVIVQNSFELSTTDIVFVIAYILLLPKNYSDK